MLFRAKKAEKYNWRFELKYRISPWQYNCVKNALQPYMQLDDYTLVSPSDGYLVRSLYFDTFDYKAYHEKMGGDFGRIKIRVRSYTDLESENLPLRVELKTRRGSAMEKFSTFIPAQAFAEFLKTWHWPESIDRNDPVLMEFERLLHLRALRPKILVTYQREGFTSRSREDLRITFDHHVRSASASSLFPQNPFFRDHHRHVTILEIKCRNQRPVWLTEIVKRHNLKVVANSKYTQGIEVVRPDVVNPMWSQGYMYRPSLITRKKQIIRPASPIPRFPGGL